MAITQHRTDPPKPTGGESRSAPHGLRVRRGRVLVLAASAAAVTGFGLYGPLAEGPSRAALWAGVGGLILAAYLAFAKRRTRRGADDARDVRALGIDYRQLDNGPTISTAPRHSRRR